MRLQLDRYESSLVPLLLVTDEYGSLRALEFAGDEPRLHRLLRLHYGDYQLREGAAPRPITRALDAYFNGDINALADLPVETGGTPFQRDVWAALREIPAGETRSYGQIAGTIGCPGASRAVGAANGANPVAIVVPCHRVIGADGTLTGYAGGLARKRWLLDHERRYSRCPVEV
ncbi:MAG TPA: methylated-DNA--[protein]-cysteine S-methyltransferase [Pirellulales bacterium]|jgi:O-6-methylguanine DNA methyltransferase|nr:methylated-DNA--[protein]-cysteine S-methyltransferase [Pirellulales bacterium]